ncbi:MULTISPECIES: PAS domain-containing protein [Sulfurimonas]|uniref:PAS domain-containing protein n=1 Tax=Sulfurimonas diazotrophicus TaxID=3131939 RepID=A0ABZ3H8C1_9BACT
MQVVEPIDEEFKFEGRAIVSETDLNGIITFANRKFCEISGYTKEELIGQPHNIIRHPDMPKKAFEMMWNTIKQGNVWTGLVKNLRKDGRYYWVETTITPIQDETGAITKYAAARKGASEAAIEEAETLYERLRGEEAES